MNPLFQSPTLKDLLAEDDRPSVRRAATGPAEAIPVASAVPAPSAPARRPLIFSAVTALCVAVAVASVALAAGVLFLRPAAEPVKEVVYVERPAVPVSPPVVSQQAPVAPATPAEAKKPAEVKPPPLLVVSKIVLDLPDEEEAPPPPAVKPAPVPEKKPAGKLVAKVEEQDVKVPPVAAGIKAGEAESKKTGKPLMYWYGDVDFTDVKVNKFLTALGDQVVHCQENRSEDRRADVIGPRVQYQGKDGKWYDIFVANLADWSAGRVRYRLDLPGDKSPPPDPTIANGFRYRNNPNGDCLFCSVDAVLAHQGYDLRTQKDLGYGRTGVTYKSPGMIAAYLNDKGVPAYWTPPGFRDVDYLKQVTGYGWPCEVGVGMIHAINLVGIDDQWARVIDNNGPAAVHKIPTRQFLEEWDGTTVVIPPKGETFENYVGLAKWGKPRTVRLRNLETGTVSMVSYCIAGGPVDEPPPPAGRQRPAPPPEARKVPAGGVQIVPGPPRALDGVGQEPGEDGEPTGRFVAGPRRD